MYVEMEGRKRSGYARLLRKWVELGYLNRFRPGLRAHVKGVGVSMKVVNLIHGGTI